MRTAAQTRRLGAPLEPGQRRAVFVMSAVVLGLHVLGFFLLLAVVVPGRHRLAAGGTLTIGVGLTAYVLGLRHAFDADHISAIDNTTRKLIAEGKRPMTTGFWFSLGHSTVVFALSLVISLGVRSLGGAVRNGHSALHQVTGWVGTTISGTFLYLIAALNVVILLGILRVVREMRCGRYDEAALEQQLDRRGLMNRCFGGMTRTVSQPRHLYPIGVLFGLGFDTASEVALLVIAASAGAAGLPWYGVLCLPVLFAAGMSLLDCIDGAFMNVAYGWALSRPVRKIFYNIALTGLSVAVAGVIGTIELGGLLAEHLNASGAFWTWLEHIDLNLLGLVIVGLFVLTWVLALAVWHLGHIEERWSTHLSRYHHTSWSSMTPRPAASSTPPGSRPANRPNGWR